MAIKLTDATGDAVYRAFAEWMVAQHRLDPEFFANAREIAKKRAEP